MQWQIRSATVKYARFSIMRRNIDITKSTNEMQNFCRINRTLCFIQFRLEFLRICGLLWNPTGMESVMRKISCQIEEEQIATKNLCNGMEEIIRNYQRTENIIIDYLGSHAKEENIAFDDRGRYGGDQGYPASIDKTDEKYDEIAEIIRRYYPDYSDREIEKYLKKLNSEGCGYVALINTIFNQYAGRADEFERIFGFPMYDKNGDLNFDLMLVDFYAAMDNHHSILGLDIIFEFEDSSATEGYGTTANTREYRWEKYLQDRGVNVDVHSVNVTIENFNDLSENGDIIIATHPVILYDENGRRLYADGGHAMTVTGVTEDGRFVVSSWGEKYYIEPDASQFDRINFQQITY